MTAKQSGKKPTGWITLELDGHLLTGEYRGGRWVWECETMDLPAETERCMEQIEKFVERVNRGRTR